MSDQKPKEFFAIQLIGSEPSNFLMSTDESFIEKQKWADHKPFKVIEKSAYDAALNLYRKAMLDWAKESLEMQQLRADLDLAIEAILGLMAEAQQNLRMYVQSYKREPYDTGIMLEIYIKDFDQRMMRHAETLAKLQEKP